MMIMMMVMTMMMIMTMMTQIIAGNHSVDHTNQSYQSIKALNVISSQKFELREKKFNRKKNDKYKCKHSSLILLGRLVQWNGRCFLKKQTGANL